MSERLNWLSYGGGVNSTALAVLLVQGRFPELLPFGAVFADTKTEKPQTYQYIDEHFRPWLAARGIEFVVVSAAEGVLERWERLRVTGSRIIRACSTESKIKPIERFTAGRGGLQIIGIDAGEAHRARPRPGKVYPLVDADIDRDDCLRIIRDAGLPDPGKSGCWCCPFMRVQEVVHLAKADPCSFARIKRLEEVATATHGPQPDGSPRTQWGDRPAAEYERAARQGDLLLPDRAVELPCECIEAGA